MLTKKPQEFAEFAFDDPHIRLGGMEKTHSLRAVQQFFIENVGQYQW